MEGEVQCLDMHHCTGEGVLRYAREEGGEKAWKVKVRGEVTSYGVALLLDELGNTWLYSVPGAVGRCLKELKGDSLTVTLAVSWCSFKIGF